jgi:dipeptidyl aminopeptidase/acylaminoacyl peptidase
MKIKSLILLSILCISSAACRKKSTETIPAGNFTNALTGDEIRLARITPEVLWKFGRVSDHQVSPDRKTVIFGVTRYDVATNLKMTDIFSVPAEGGDTMKLTDSRFSCSNHRFIPGTDLIAYISAASGSPQIWSMNRNGGMKRRMTDFKDGINGFEFAPDGIHLFYTRDVKVDESPLDRHPDLPLTNVIIAEDLMYRHWDSWTDYRFSHIFISRMESEKIPEGTDIMEGEPFDSPLSPYFEQSEISWSPDSKYLAYTCKKMRGREYAVSTNSDIYMYSLESRETTNLSAGMAGYDKYPVFSNDGKKIAWQSMATPGYEADKVRLFVTDIGTGQRNYLTRGFDQDVSDPEWAAGDSVIYFISGHHATFQIYRISTATGKITQVTNGIHDYTSFTLCGRFLIGEKMSMSMATEIFRIDAENGLETQISFVNKNIYDAVKMGRVEERWIKTTDRKDMLVWVIYPPDFNPERKYPALLYCQGGPQTAVSQFFSFRWNLQIMAAHDYIIIAPNRRGLPTFGEEWNRQISGDYGGQNMQDYLSATDALSQEPFVDKSRLGAVGASYGGYSVFYLAGHHQGRFRAFISHCGIYDLISMYGATEESFFVNFDLEGPYWQKPIPVSYSYSPHLYVDKWDTPIMIITGGNDLRVPYTQSLEAFNAARLRGIPARLLYFPDESHFVLKPQNAVLWQREFFSWLDKWLKE